VIVANGIRARALDCAVAVQRVQERTLERERVHIDDHVYRSTSGGFGRLALRLLLALEDREAPLVDRPQRAIGEDRGRQRIPEGEATLDEFRLSLEQGVHRVGLRRDVVPRERVGEERRHGSLVRRIEWHERDRRA
jgi:hypothetical protein